MYSVPALAHPKGLTRFLASKSASKWGADLASEYPHTRYYRDRSDSFSLHDLNRYGAAIIDAKRAGTDVNDALEEALPPQSLRSTWHHEVRKDVRSYLREHVSEAVIDRNIDDIEDLWREAADQADDSSVTDLFASYDHVELVWKIGRHDYVDDCLIYSHRPWPDSDEIQITDNLQYALNVMGYTVGDFRKHTGNKHPAYSPLPSARRRRQPIVTLDHIVEAIDNACSTNFMFAIYAIVPITDLIALDLTKPITFDKCWIATTDPMNGTFHDVPATGPVTLQDGPDGELRTGGHFRYEPAEICCLHTPHYHARVRN